MSSTPEQHEQVVRPDGRRSGRRSFIKSAAAVGAGGVSLAAASSLPIDDRVAHATQNVSRASKPSQLKITDLRIAVLEGVPFTSPIVRIDTNQGITGWGEVRDDADPRYALMLKSRLLGENPCNVEMLFKRIAQFGGHGRQGGGVSGVEMALWDLAGKAYGVPVYAMLGGQYRNKVRVYTDATESEDPEEYAARMKERVDAGVTFLKMDLGLSIVKDIPGTIVGESLWGGDLGQYNGDPKSYGMTEHAFTQVQITDKGLDEMAKYVAAVRNAIGYDIPLGMDHTGHFGVDTAIRLTNRFQEFHLAYQEDLVPWFYHDDWRQITESVNVPTMTGEDMYGFDAFQKIIDDGMVELIHPDPATAGGILETKRIGDYAERNHIATMLHYAGSPIGAIASAHIAAATNGFQAQEYHAWDVDGWDDLVDGMDKPLMKDGFYTLTDRPGLGVDLNLDAAKKFLKKGTKLFPKSDEWNENKSWDRIWS
ncbi:L-alanine-DL-glutamate epimerase-like enolase superfamily enzyme [Haloactinopolyspora alba]|uniref:L-alanine-DL-glutamate epimerase-like enolase superfamily enzyme n=1 Tax=Haloactinopolyspora alba TaxID=648780 RepID=A0A2P8E2E9_9ACTN|nr:mandelate racemase/muconate lactonizing enzyme family protein [Haloactinopolyspora alba]PSL03641.1 L-alanine-DL-glutamate epimerase-like enolase superfamily enzyme [Haloactinopolyspora alba]